MKENLAENPPVEKKHLPIFTVISVVFLVITLCTSIASRYFDSWINPKHKLTLSESFHIGLGQWIPICGSITFFNGEMPYCGGIISLSNGEEPTYERVWYLWIYGFSHVVRADELGKKNEVMYCCDLPGIYFRYFKLTSSTIWTLTISLWLPLVFFSVLPCIQIWKYRKKKRFR